MADEKEEEMNRVIKGRVENVLADGLMVRLSPGERDALLEIAFLAMVSDGLLLQEEIENFTEAMRVLFRDDVTEELTRDTVRNLVENREWEDCEACLQEITGSLHGSFARVQAFKLGYLMTLSDYHTNSSETWFIANLQKALNFTGVQGERMADEVIDAIEIIPPACKEKAA
jgi:hypothetical protein